MNEETAVATIGTGREIVVKGKVRGVVYGFTGDMSAREIKESIKTSQGLKGRALTEAVNKALRDASALAEVKLSAVLAKARQGGFAPDTATLRDKSMNIRFVKIEAPKPTKVEVRAKKAEEAVQALTGQIEKLREILAARGATPDEIAAILPA